MTKHRITITVDPDIDQWLQRGSNAYGRSLSELVRICLREFIHEDPNRFSTVDKARTETPEAWRVIRKDQQKS